MELFLIVDETFCDENGVSFVKMTTRHAIAEEAKNDGYLVIQLNTNIEVEEYDTRMRRQIIVVL